MEDSAGRGLIAGHAYTLSQDSQITFLISNNGELYKISLTKNISYGIYESNAVELPDGTQLVCLRNPWGQAEWDGPWSDGSSQWDDVAETDLTVRKIYDVFLSNHNCDD